MNTTLNPAAESAGHGRTAIEMKAISKVYGGAGNQTQALQHVDFSASYGQLIAVVGPSGSGKSTFLEIAGGLQPPTAGSLAIDGHPYQGLSARKREELRLNSIGFVLQGYSLVPYLTVEEQFQLVRKVKRTPNLDRDTFARVLNRLGIDALLNQYPESLSGGQRQRAAIARSLYADPKIVLADEPTASLDTPRAFEVMEIFRDLAHALGKTIVVVTHDTRLERYVDALYSITDGVMRHESVRAMAEN
ncbi:ABC transporter ATP-binding protein [Bifidobacterium sp.]|jgi:putative ABC transport system ATP-binding protein|uniref:ABC transporter ATP-binding protein n=1 Tax=Bifidobacterium sp. TaxID=41200 RepID=UPI0025B7FE44|nr:ABC transporter ATP-binding protein [Bifidobacterium sp.]MCH4208731.1 ABC transporter ATP-binding protein [Bifidobacterium sp.]MCI1225599.1 ABC transporter ATP-binding protein [Bifidobacterium sp.]